MKKTAMSQKEMMMVAIMALKKIRGAAEINLGRPE